ncbi:MAG: DUF6531 domain-containing protein, partial [Myxococcota bacterium]
MEDRPDVAFSGDASSVQAVADSLGNDAVRIYEFVRNELEYQPYYGLMKGPVATLESRAGNDYDLAALLVSLYRASGIPARFARGRIEVAGPEAAAWTGTEASTGAHARNLWATIEPPHWLDPGNEAIGAAHMSQGAGSVQKLHVWVEAQVPMARYRGTGATQLAGSAWIALDPSYKLRDWKPDPDLPIGSLALTFDYDGPTGYYRSLNEKLPSEVFEEQVTRWLALNRPGTSVEEAMYWGPIREERPGILPNSLPYAVKSVTRHASLVSLHCFSLTPNPSCLNPTVASGDDGAIDYRHQWNLTLSGAGSFVGWTAALQGRRVSLTFPPTLADANSVPPGGYGDADCNQSIQTRPTITVDGTVVPGLTSTPNLCSPLTVTIEDIRPNPGGPATETLNTAGTYTIKAGGTYLLALDAYAASAEGTQRVADALRVAHQTYPVLSNAPAPYVDVDHDETKDPNEPYLGRDFETQEKLVGGLLHLASARYFEDRIQSARKLDGLHQRLRAPSASAGLIQSAPAVEYVLGIPFTVRAPDLVIDLQALTLGLVDRTGAPLDYELWPAGRETHHEYLLGNEDSALEHVVWEEIAGLEAVSTVRGLQLQLSTTNVNLLKIRSNAEGTAALGSCRPLGTQANATVVRARSSIPDFGLGWAGVRFLNLASTPNISLCEDRLPGPLGFPTSCDITVNKSDIEEVRQDHCQGIDRVTHCTVSQGPVEVAPNLNRLCSAIPISTPQEQQSIADSVGELWITNRSFFRFDTFSGFVYYKRWKNGTSAFAIQPTDSPRPFGGGFVIRNYDLDFLVDPSVYSSELLLAGTPIPQSFLDLYGSDSSALSLALLVNPARQMFGTTYDDPFSLPLDSVEAIYGPLHKSTLDLDSIILNGRETTAGDPVSVVTGAFFMTEVDLQIAGPGGLGIRMIRAYDSRLDYDGSLGHGWTHTYDQHLRFDPGDAADITDDRLVWVTEEATERSYGVAPDGAPITPLGVYDVLEAEGTGYVLRLKGGARLRFGPTDAANRSSLLSIEDRNGNRVWCRYDANNRLTSVDYGDPELAVGFLYDGAGRLDRVEDWTGRRWEYSVDASGNLVAYKDPEQVALGAAGRAWAFEYETSPNAALNHNLTRWVRPADRNSDGQGDVWMRFHYYADDTVMKHESSVGDVAWFAYNRFRKRTTMSHPDGTSQVYVYDRWGNVIRYEDENGVATTYEYDGPRREMVAEIDALGFRAELEYDSRGNVTRRKNRLAKSETWTYNTFGQPMSHVDREGRERRFEYDAKGNLLREFATLDGRLDLVRSSTYDARGNPTAMTEYASLGGGDPATTHFEYDSQGVAVRRTVDALGHSVQIEPDALGRPRTFRSVRTRKTDGGSVPETIVTTVEHDDLDRPFQRVDAAGTRGELTYDANGKVVLERTIPPPPAAARVDAVYRYDDFDRLVEVDQFPRPSDAETTSFEYDSKGRATRIITPLGSDERRMYDGVGRVVETVDAIGAIRRFVYDAVGRPVDEIDPTGRELRTQYDAEGRVVRTWLEYDGISASLRPFDANASPEQSLQRLSAKLTYDDVGNVLTATDAKGHTTTTVYDELDRPIQITGPEGPDLPANEASLISSEYDLAGRLLSRTEKLLPTSPATKTTRVHYDRLGRVDSTTDPLGRHSTLRYDEVGNLIETVNGAGEKLEYRHDARGLLLRRTGPLVDDEFGYDALGRQTLARNATSTRTFRYDGLDRAIEMGDSQFGTARRVFDRDGRLNSVIYPDDPASGFPSGIVVHYGYDRRGLLTTVSDPVAGVWRSAYDATGRITSERLPGGIERAFEYRPEGWLAQVELRRGATLLETFAHSDYDELGNARLLESGEGTTHVEYDARSRVTSVVYREGTQRETSETFSYDLVGNRIAHTRDGEASSYQVDAADQLSAILDDNQQVLETFTHDAAGRRRTHVAGGQTTTYAYDAIGRLRSVAAAGQPATDLAYDALGARYRRTVGGVESASYLDEWAERREGEVRRLIHGGGIDQVLAEVTGGATPASY